MTRSFTSKSPPPAKFPLGTVIVYGPNASLATKLVASVVPRRDAEPSAERKWSTVAADVRTDPVIAEDLAAFLREHGVRQTVTHDRILGCPHEEGIDYPLGRTCPACPFWANIDRFTHEPIAPPAATMTPEEVLEELSLDHSTPPYTALESADAHRGALVEPLLAAIGRALDDPRAASDEDASLFSHALYLFAKWREPRAYPSVIRWLSLPEEAPFEIGGDIVTQDGGRILASVCDGDLAPIERLILNRDADPWGRAAGVRALALLAAWAEVPRDRVVQHFLWLAADGLGRESSLVLDELAAECADIEAREVFPVLHSLYAERLLDPRVMAERELDEVEAAPRGETVAETRARWPPITDVAKAIGWWASFHPREPRRVVKVGRNDPCPCGSGRKYKKCCGA